MTTELYSLRQNGDHRYTITKFNADYDVMHDGKGNECIYDLDVKNCSCPAGERPTCRHRKMLPLFLQHKHVGDGWFLDWSTRLWRKALHHPELADEQMMGRADSERSDTRIEPESQALDVDELARSLEYVGIKTVIVDEIEAPAPTSERCSSAPVATSVGASPFRRRKL